jgi:integrase
VSVKRTKTGYQVDVRLADDKRHRKSFRTKQAADKYEREMLDQREQGVLPTHGSGTLADFIAEWKSTVYPTIRANTISGYESALNQHILPAFGELKLQKIDQRLVQDWVNDLVAEGLSPRTVELNFAVLSTISKLASEYRLMKPLKKSGRGRGGVRLPRNVPKTRKPPTIGEIEHLVHVIDPPYKAMVRLAGYCGLRQSECWGLHPSSIDFERHKIHIRRTVEHTTRSLVDLTKSGKPRTVTMTAPVAESLREHMASWPTASTFSTTTAGTSSRATSTATCGTAPAKPRACPTCGSTTCATPRRRSWPPPGGARRKSSSSSATTAPASPSTATATSSPRRKTARGRR